MGVSQNVENLHHSVQLGVELVFRRPVQELLVDSAGPRFRSCLHCRLLECEVVGVHFFRRKLCCVLGEILIQLRVPNQLFKQASVSAGERQCDGFPQHFQIFIGQGGDTLNLFLTLTRQQVEVIQPELRVTLMGVVLVRIAPMRIVVGVAVGPVVVVIVAVRHSGLPFFVYPA